MRSTNTITPECFDCELWRAASALREGEPGPAAGRGGSCCRGTPVGKPLLCRFPPPPPKNPSLHWKSARWKKIRMGKTVTGNGSDRSRRGQRPAPRRTTSGPGPEEGAAGHPLQPAARPAPSGRRSRTGAPDSPPPPQPVRRARAPAEGAEPGLRRLRLRPASGGAGTAAAANAGPGPRRLEDAGNGGPLRPEPRRASAPAGPGQLRGPAWAPSGGGAGRRAGPRPAASAGAAAGEAGAPRARRRGPYRRGQEPSPGRGGGGGAVCGSPSHAAKAGVVLAACFWRGFPPSGLCPPARAGGGETPSA